jgi:hypothetical protein
MTHSNSLKLLAGAAAAAVLLPAVADAKLGGQPTLTKIDSHHASLRFAADQRPTKITFAGGQKVGTVSVVGKHGTDPVFRARVTSTSALRAGVKYTVTFKAPGEASQKVLVKLRG